MAIGFDRPLDVLPFDHRGTFQKNMFGWEGPLTDEQTARIAREAAVREIARRDREWVDIDESAGSAAAQPRGSGDSSQNRGDQNRYNH